MNLKRLKRGESELAERTYIRKNSSTQFLSNSMLNCASKTFNCLHWILCLLSIICVHIFLQHNFLHLANTSIVWYTNKINIGEYINDQISYFIFVRIIWKRMTTMKITEELHREQHWNESVANLDISAFEMWTFSIFVSRHVIHGWLSHQKQSVQNLNE